MSLNKNVITDAIAEVKNIVANATESTQINAKLGEVFSKVPDEENKGLNYYSSNFKVYDEVSKSFGEGKGVSVVAIYHREDFDGFYIQSVTFNGEKIVNASLFKNK